jgi:hypothetical protein
MKRKPYLQTLDRLKAKCDEIGDCWIWLGAHDGKGRPVCVHNGKRISPRRLARQFTEGREIPRQMVTACRCGDNKCISPACSVVVTTKTAHRMAADRGAYSNAARDRRMALTKRAASPYGDEAIEAVRLAESATVAAKETGMSPSHAKAIRAGRSRKDYSSPFAGLGG